MFKTPLKALLLGSALVATSFATSFSAQAQNMHDSWNALLNKYVVAINHNHSTEVDYAAIKREHAQLKTYLDSLTAVTQSEFDAWEKPKQLAFLINAYNAWTVELILTKYPDIKSIKAVNCASIGCPALREEAYTATDLESQLQEQTVRFLSDMTRNMAQENTLSVSSIFKWYGDDFEKGFRGANTLQQFFLQYPDALKLIPAQQKALKNDDMKVKFLDYNWDLNVRH